MRQRGAGGDASGGALTCDRDSRGSSEHSVCRLRLWASRSTKITDQEQPCGDKRGRTCGGVGVGVEEDSAAPLPGRFRSFPGNANRRRWGASGTAEGSTSFEHTQSVFLRCLAINLLIL